MRLFPSAIPLAALTIALSVYFEYAHAALYRDAAELPTTTYDFVIVGGGTAGNVMAARLSENPSFSILVIEAGISNEGALSIQVPFLAPTILSNASVIWNYTTVPQPGLAERAIPYPRGRVLGGSSSINFLAYTRSADEEFDQWAQMVGDPGWTWESLAPYYFKNSRLVPPADKHDMTGEVDPADHGFGPVEVSVAGFPNEIDPLVLGTSKAPGSEFPYNLDVNSGKPIGLSYLQNTVGNGERSSSATAYLTPALERKNLHVLITNTVTRLIQTGSQDGKPAFRKVEFAPSASAKRSTVTARKEVILSAGSINTPQILMLSGIGDRGPLAKLGITPRVDLPDVGQHLHDHPIVANYWFCASNATLDNVFREQGVYDADMSRWMRNRTGVFADTPGNAIAYLRIPEEDQIWQNFSDPTPGPNTPHYEMLFYDGFSANAAPLPPTGHYFSINTIVVSPMSVGSVTLASTSPFDFPNIDPAFFSSPFDAQAMLYAIKAARRFVSTAPWDGYITAPYAEVSSAESDEDIIAAARRNTITIWHPTSTARMAPLGAPWGVVDPKLRVKGTSGLRIVDASVLPTIPAGHPMAAVYIYAERAADLVKQTWA